MYVDGHLFPTSVHRLLLWLSQTGEAVQSAVDVCFKFSYLLTPYVNCQKKSKGSREFCHLMPKVLKIDDRRANSRGGVLEDGQLAPKETHAHYRPPSKIGAEPRPLNDFPVL